MTLPEKMLELQIALGKKDSKVNDIIDERVLSYGNRNSWSATVSHKKVNYKKKRNKKEVEKNVFKKTIISIEEIDDKL